MVMPQLAANQTTLNLVRKYIVPAYQQTDFICLSSNAVWRGKAIKALLAHVELANYNRTLVNWRIEDQILYAVCPLAGDRLSSKCRFGLAQTALGELLSMDQERIELSVRRTNRRPIPSRTGHSRAWRF